MRLSLALLAVLAAAAPAAATPPWSAPAPITEPGRMGSDPLPVTSADGTTAVFYRRESTGAAGGVCSFVFRVSGAATFGGPRQLHGGCAGAVPYARRSVAALTLTSTPRGNTYSVAFGSSRGSFGRAKRMVSGAPVRRGSLAGNPEGTLAFAWFEDNGTRNDEVRVRIRPAGGSFGRAIRLDRDRVRNVVAAVGVRGEVLVAYEVRGHVKVRIRRRGHRRFDTAQTLRTDAAYNADLQAAVTANGRAIVAWSAKFLSEGGTQGPKFTEVAVRPAGSTRFYSAQRLERDPEGRIDLGNLRLVNVPSGPPLVAWTGREGGRAVVRVSESLPNGAFSPPVTVSPLGEDSHLTSVARGTDGQVAVAWSRDFDTPSQVYAAVRGPGAVAFGPAEQVSTGEDARRGQLTFGPDGRLTAVWQDISGVGDDRVLRIFAAERGS